MSVNSSQRAMLANYLLGQHSSAVFGKNYIKNSMAVANTANVTAANSATVARNTTSALTGIADFAVTLPNNTTGYVEWAMNTLDNSLNGQNCEFRMDYSAASLGSVVQVEILQSGNVVVSQVLNTTSKTVSLNVPCGAVPSTTVRISNATGNSGTSSLNVANLTYGKASNIGTVAQAKLVGTVTVTGCSAQWSIASTTFASFGTQTGCSYAVTGEALAPITNIPAIRFASLPPGEYKLEYEGNIIAASGVNSFYQFFDGTNTSREQSSISLSASTPSISGISHSISYSSPQSNVTLQIRAKSVSGSSIISGTTTLPGVIRVYYFPSASQQAYNPAMDNWKVDANISGANPSLGSAAVSSYTGIENASLTLTNNTGAGNLTAQIPCSGTNSPSGTTCSVGNESVGVSFVLPKAGDVMACASFAHHVDGGRAEVTFQIVETPNNAQTISQEGKSRIMSGGAVSSGTFGGRYPHRLCGTFTFTSAGQKTLRLMYEMTVGAAAVNQNTILGDASTSDGQRDIHWEVYPITQNVPAPVLVGSVTSNSAGAERIERAEFVCSSSSSVTSQSGSWLSIGNISSNRCTLTFTTGTFSATPVCTCNVKGTSTNVTYSCIPSVTSATAATVGTVYNIGGTTTASANESYYMTCMGPR